MIGKIASRRGALALGLAATGAVAQETEAEFQPFTFAGTVVAREITGLSYETGGCIVSVSDSARRTGAAESGQLLVELDAQDAELALETAKARVADLEAAVAEKQLAIDAAEANVDRRAQELAFVGKEFARNEQMFRRGLINESTMEGVESRMMNADFAADQAKETLASAISAKKRAEIALDIGQHELHLFGREGVGQGEADTAGRPGDDCHLLLEGFHGSSRLAIAFKLTRWGCGAGLQAQLSPAGTQWWIESTRRSNFQTPASRR